MNQLALHGSDDPLLPVLRPHEINFLNFFFVMQEPPIPRFKKISDEYPIVPHTDMDLIANWLIFIPKFPDEGLE